MNRATQANPSVQAVPGLSFTAAKAQGQATGDEALAIFDALEPLSLIHI